MDDPENDEVMQNNIIDDLDISGQRPPNITVTEDI